VPFTDEEYTRKRLEACLRHRERDTVNDVELANYLIMVLATSRSYALVEEFVQRLPSGARDAAVMFAREIAVEGWATIPWGLGAPYPSGEVLMREVAACKEVARLVLALEARE
jgi:hypothetical protein